MISQKKVNMKFSEVKITILLYDNVNMDDINLAHSLRFATIYTVLALILIKDQSCCGHDEWKT